MKILLDEDDVSQAKQMKRLIASEFAGSHVTTAYTLEEAKAALNKDSFEVLLVNLVLHPDNPKGDQRLLHIDKYDGSRVLRHARDGGSRALALLFTASNNVDRKFLLYFADRYQTLDVVLKNAIHGSLTYSDIILLKLKVAKNFLKERG